MADCHSPHLVNYLERTRLMEICKKKSVDLVYNNLNSEHSGYSRNPLSFPVFKNQASECKRKEKSNDPEKKKK